ncbi:hypothetical protein WL99_12475 [Burkholderia cepacia]|nr:helix-turn-helix domain-containing protein [Burkholderia cepacia]KWH31894.1 hypothetical protein WL99_12475 [Burkholderia cepacia]
METEAAALACNVSQPLGPRWFREAGGMAPIDRAPHSGRYLSFSEREEIAFLWAQDCSVREIFAKAATVATLLTHQAHRALSDFRGKLGYLLVHGTIYMDASRLQGISNSDVTGTVAALYPALLQSVVPLRATMESADPRLISLTSS